MYICRWSPEKTLDCITSIQLLPFYSLFFFILFFPLLQDDIFLWTIFVFVVVVFFVLVSLFTRSYLVAFVDEYSVQPECHLAVLSDQVECEAMQFTWLSLMCERKRVRARESITLIAFYTLHATGRGKYFKCLSLFSLFLLYSFSLLEKWHMENNLFWFLRCH